MRRNERGNAIVMILIGVALFGALAMTFMRGSQQGQGNLTKHQARLAAQELLDFFSATEKAVMKLQLRGCSEDQIAFNTNYDGAYASANVPAGAPPDKSCHVFDPAGGGLIIKNPPSYYQVPVNQLLVVTQNYNTYPFRIQRPIIGLGTSANELTVQIDVVQPEICEAYNAILQNGVDPSIYETPDTDPILGNENTTLVGKTTFCVRRSNFAEWTGGGKYQIVYVWSIH